MVLLRQQIELMLNPNEEDHNALIACLDRVRVAAWEKHKHHNLSSSMDDLTARCKAILKKEWERVKKGD
jgi:hypothetical protein